MNDSTLLLYLPVYFRKNHGEDQTNKKKIGLMSSKTQLEAFSALLEYNETGLDKLRLLASTGLERANKDGKGIKFHCKRTS